MGRRSSALRSTGLLTEGTGDDGEVADGGGEEASDAVAAKELGDPAGTGEGAFMWLDGDGDGDLEGGPDVLGLDNEPRFFESLSLLSDSN
jgi:hypothetical protein